MELGTHESGTPTVTMKAGDSLLVLMDEGKGAYNYVVLSTKREYQDVIMTVIPQIDTEMKHEKPRAGEES